MATSGTISFSMNVNRIINSAFSKIGVKQSEQELQPEEFQDGIDAINLMIKSWASQPLHLWSKTEGVLFLDAGKSDYNLGPNGDEACDLDDFIGAKTTTPKITNDVIIQVDSTIGMIALDKVGIELDDNTRHWTTIVNVDSPVQITITTGIPSNSKSGSSLFTFTNLISRPQRIISYRRKKFFQDSEIEIIKWSRDEYFNQVNKLSQGTVVNAYYSPQLKNGRVYVWQTASSVNDLLRFTFERQLEDVTDGDQTLDFPAEWELPIIYNLASLLSDDYDVPPIKLQSVNTKAINFLDDVLGWDAENTSLFAQPDFD